jgi:hypothetical protein
VAFLFNYVCRSSLWAQSQRHLRSPYRQIYVALEERVDIPQEVTIEDKALVEQVKLIQELEPEEKSMVFKMVDTFLTQKKFKDFFQKNIATL